MAGKVPAGVEGGGHALGGQLGAAGLDVEQRVGAAQADGAGQRSAAACVQQGDFTL